MFKDVTVLRIVLFPFYILTLVIFLFVERLKGVPIKISLNDLAGDDFGSCTTKCYRREL